MSFAQVLPNADGSRLALVPYVGRTKISVVDAASFTPIATLAVPRGADPADPGWMPDGRAIVAAYHGAGGADDIGIFSSDTGRMTWSAPLPFRVADRGGPVVSPDGTHALIVAAHGRDPYGKRLYTVDLRSGAVTETYASLQDAVTSPVYLDAGRAVIIEQHLGYSGLSEIDLGSGSVRSLTSSDLDVFDLAGVDASGDVVFTGYHVTPDLYVTTTEDREHPIVGEVDVETGDVRDLFEPGVIGALRTFDAGDRAVALADTCTGDCGGGEEVWVLDLSRY